MPALLNEMPPDWAAQLFLHPIHQEAFPALVQLIVDLRKCRDYKNHYHFQQGLLEKLLEVQEHRGSCTRIAHSLRHGKPYRRTLRT